MADSSDLPQRLVLATGHALSLALLDGPRLLAEYHEAIFKGHAEALMPAIAQLLRPFGGRMAPVDSIIVETGPGSFTGLRIGLAAAQALGLTWGVPVHGVRSTQLTQAAARARGFTGPLLVALAAPRGQIWTEAFAADGASAGPPLARTPQEVRDDLAADSVVVGSGAGLLGRDPGEPPRASAFRWLVSDPSGPADLLYVRQAGA